MATKIPGETYRGEAVTLPLSEDGQVSVYVWPCRILNVRGMGMGGPTMVSRTVRDHSNLGKRHELKGFCVWRKTDVAFCRTNSVSHSD